MMDIWSNKEYQARHTPPIIAEWPAPYGKKSPNVVFWYLITPKGKVSKYWHYVWSRVKSHERVAEQYEPAVRKTWKGLLKHGYTLSQPYKY